MTSGTDVSGTDRPHHRPAGAGGARCRRLGPLWRTRIAVGADRHRGVPVGCLSVGNPDRLRTEDGEPGAKITAPNRKPNRSADTPHLMTLPSSLSVESLKGWLTRHQRRSARRQRGGDQTRRTSTARAAQQRWPPAHGAASPRARRMQSGSEPQGAETHTGGPNAPVNAPNANASFTSPPPSAVGSARCTARYSPPSAAAPSNAGPPRPPTTAPKRISAPPGQGERGWASGDTADRPLKEPPPRTSPPRHRRCRGRSSAHANPAQPPSVLAVYARIVRPD